MKILEPKAQFKLITDIEIEFFKKNNIKGLILDVDNTIIDLNKKLIDNIKEWIDEVKKNDIKICIASNTIFREKIITVAKYLDIPYFYLSLKPLGRGVLKAKKKLGLPSENIAVIGDQIFTDIIIANRLKMFSILTTPIMEEKSFIKKIKRKLEKKYRGI